ncbi:Hypothetical protein ABZS17G119_02718 [Kosakonia cowanii]
MAWTDAIRDIDSCRRHRSSQHSPWDYATVSLLARHNTTGKDPEQ